MIGDSDEDFEDEEEETTAAVGAPWAGDATPEDAAAPVTPEKLRAAIAAAAAWDIALETPSPPIEAAVFKTTGVGVLAVGVKNGTAFEFSLDAFDPFPLVLLLPGTGGAITDPIEGGINIGGTLLG